MPFIKITIIITEEKDEQSVSQLVSKGRAGEGGVSWMLLYVAVTSTPYPVCLSVYLSVCLSIQIVHINMYLYSMYAHM